MSSDPHTTDAFDPEQTTVYPLNDKEVSGVSNPSHIGRYRVVRTLGHGGFGTVLLAEDDELKRSVAIKVPRSRQLMTAAGVDEFVREAQKAASLRHPSIVTIYDVGRLDETGCFVVMEYIDGVTLNELARTQRLSFQKIADLIAHIADGLAAAHHKGVYHRDVKPGNVLVEHAGFPRIVDFGLSIREEERTAATHKIAGSLPYMSPEQVRGDILRIDGRSDIWSLGVMLYELLTDRLPFWADSIQRVFLEITEGDPDLPTKRNPRVPSGLERLTMKCLSKSVEERFESADQLSKELRAWIAESGEGCWDPDAPLAMSDYDLGPAIRLGALVSLYSARQRSLGRNVTIGVLNSNCSVSATFSRWFVTQCRRLAAVSHAELIAVQGLGRTNDGGYFALMDQLTGVNLHERIAAEDLAMDTAAKVFRQVVTLVQATRSEVVVVAPLLLRDVFVQADGNIKVLAGFSHYPGSLSEGVTAYFEAEPILGPATLCEFSAMNSLQDVRVLGWFLCALLLMHRDLPNSENRIPTDAMPIVSSQSVLMRLRERGTTRHERKIWRSLYSICHKCLSNNKGAGYSSVQDLAEDVEKSMRKLALPFHRLRWILRTLSGH